MQIASFSKFYTTLNMRHRFMSFDFFHFSKLASEIMRQKFFDFKSSNSGVRIKIPSIPLRVLKLMRIKEEESVDDKIFRFVR